MSKMRCLSNKFSKVAKRLERRATSAP